MAIHDGYLRRTPFERFVPDAGFASRHFPEIRTEAEERGISLDDPGAFAMLESATTALDEVRRPDDGPETLARHALVLFHAFHFEAAGRSAFLVDAALVRTVIETEPWEVGTGAEAEGGTGAEAMPGDLLPDSCYVQLPQHLVWAGTDGDDAPASIDGFFRTVVEPHLMHLLPVVGMLEGRPGFTVLPLPGLPLSDAPTWATAQMRQGAADFSSELPGAGLEGLFEARTAGEMLKLATRLVDWVRHVPGARTALDRPSLADDARPAPSALRGERLVVGSPA